MEIFLVVESQSKTITKVQIHKNKNREEHLVMDSLGGLMDKVKEVHPRSNEGDNCKEDKEEIKREDLKQEKEVQYITHSFGFLFIIILLLS